MIVAMDEDYINDMNSANDRGKGEYPFSAD
jgi:hypothetical protein